MNPSVKQLFSNSTGAKAWFAALAKGTRLAGIALLVLVGTLLVPNSAMAQFDMGTMTPRDLVAVPGDRSVALSWEYIVMDSYVLTATASGQTTRTCSVGAYDMDIYRGTGRATCTVAPLTNGVRYELSLVATDDMSRTPSSPAIVYATPEVPVAPTVTAISPSSGTTAGGTAVTITGTSLRTYP